MGTLTDVITPSPAGTVPPNSKTVRIRVTQKYKTPFVDTEPVEIENLVTNKESITWSCSEPTFTVTFKNGSPFQKSVFTETDPNSGDPNPDATGQYKYEIDVNGVKFDPTVIVRP
jgi:hypothetical protein